MPCALSALPDRPPEVPPYRPVPATPPSRKAVCHQTRTLPVPTRNGYTFVRWELNGVPYDFSTPVTGNITLTAVWAKNESAAGGNMIAENTGYISYHYSNTQPSQPTYFTPVVTTTTTTTVTDTSTNTVEEKTDTPELKEEEITAKPTNSSKKPVVKASVLSNGNIRLKWGKVNDATKYRIYRIIGSKKKLIGETEKLSARLSSKSEGNYQYAVSAFVNGKWTSLTPDDVVSVTVE